MTTQNFTKVSETEKAIKFIIGFKFSQNRPQIVYGVNGNQDFKTGYLVECWFPKSSISEDGKIADWAAKNAYKAFGRFNPVMGDLIY